MKKLIAFLAATMLLGSLLIASIGHAEPTVEQLEQQDVAHENIDSKIGDILDPKKPERSRTFRDKYKRFDEHFGLMDAFGQDEAFSRSLDSLRKDPRAVSDAMSLYKMLSEEQSEENGFYGEARWRTVQLLGDLKGDESSAFLFDIASADMPDARKVGDLRYKIEYRLRARAVAGLEKHKAVEELERIYKQSRMMRGLAAASLYELGRAPDGIVAIDAIKNMGFGDPKDYNKKKGMPGPESPTLRFRKQGAMATEVVPGGSGALSDSNKKRSPSGDHSNDDEQGDRQ